MQTSLVMTVIGEDRPGLVDSLAGVVALHGGNWLESRMARLGGQFAGILRVELPAENAAALEEGLRALQARGLTVSVHADRLGARRAGERLSSLEIVGQDRPGIVREISRVLAQRDVNVEKLDSECASAAMSGETIFKARATIGLPIGCNLAELRQELERIGQDLIVEISLQVLPEDSSTAGTE